MSCYSPVTVFASALVLPLTETDIPDQHATIDHCAHVWDRQPDGDLECQGGCRATLRGELATRPCAAPMFGMPWSRAVLVRPEGGLS